MTRLIPQDNLFEKLFDFHRDFDRMFSRMLSNGRFDGNRPHQASEPAVPAIELYVDKIAKKFCCRVVLPGVDPKDVQIHAQRSNLTISGERKMDRPTNEVEWLTSEIWYGPFERTITLPEGVDTARMNAEYANGVYQITAPVDSSVLPRRIEVKTTSPLPRQMTAQA